MAKVVSVGEAAPVAHPELDQNGRRKRIEDLLRRYPDIKEAETQEVVRFLATGPHLDVGLIAGNDSLADKVKAIRKANPSHFGLKARETLLFVACVGGPAAVLLAKYLLM
ncbi:MAG: hypothetical protein ACK40O_12885 [Allosphingosinicella sp.]